jgi:molybdopterin molybdotransferase
MIMAAPSVASAFATWMAAVPTLPAGLVATDAALGLVLAADVLAAHDLPPFARAMMDGYAVRLADAGATRPVAGAVHAGDAPGVLPAGAVLAIMTGAPVPVGAEAVVPRELCSAADGIVTLPAALRAQANIVARGAEAAAGSVVLRSGERIGPLAIAAAAALGVERLPVVRRPRVAIITTGSELRQGGELASGAIRDSNGPMLIALCAGLGLTATRSTCADDPLALQAAITAAEADLIICTGGVSAGDKDHVPAVLAAAGFTTLVRGVDQKPGKPLLLAQRSDRLVAALPGNPLAVHWCFTRFVAPALRRMMALDPGPAREPGVLDAVLPGSKDRPWFIPARTRRVDGRLLVTPLPPVSSGDVIAPAHADAYLAVAAGAQPRQPGETVEIMR